MRSPTFRDFIDRLTASAELHTVTVEVDPDREIAAVTARVCKSGDNRALLFTRVRGSRFPVLTNAFGSARRMALALGINRLADLTDRLDSLLEEVPGDSATERLRALTAAPGWRAAAPLSGPPPAELLTAAVDLNTLPVLKNHPLDGQPAHAGKFLTLPLVITADRHGTEVNCGMYRAGVIAPDRLVVSWNSSSGAARHAVAWARQDEAMPVVIALGCSAVLTLAATLPLPAFVDEFTFAGLLQGEPLRSFRCNNGLSAPYDAEIVMEGYLEPEHSPSGAFGNHTGFYTPSGPAAVLKVTAVRQRPDLILPATVVGRPPMENCWLARAGGCLLLSLLKRDVPEVIALHQPFAGIFHGAAFIAAQTADRTGRELLAAIGSTPWFSGARLLVLVDAEQDPADEAGVLWRVMNSVDGEKDLLFSAGRLAIDATARASAARTAVKADPGTINLIEHRWKEYGFDC